MSAKKYDVLTKIFFLVAVLSSLVYGKLGAFNWLAVTFGVIAAVGAVSTYFYNARRLSEPSEKIVSTSPVKNEVTVSDASEIKLIPNMMHCAESSVSTDEAKKIKAKIVASSIVGSPQGSLWDDDVSDFLEHDPHKRERYLLVVGHAGMGKTSLMAEYVRQQPSPAGDRG